MFSSQDSGILVRTADSPVTPQPPMVPQEPNRYRDPQHGLQMRLPVIPDGGNTAKGL